MPNTKVVGIIFPYILTPIPNLYDHSFPRYGQITFLTFRRPTTLTFDLKFWKYLSVTVYPYVICMPSFIMIGWEMAEILHVFAKTRTNTQTNTHTNKQTDMGITIPRPPPMGGEVITNIVGYYMDMYIRCPCVYTSSMISLYIAPCALNNGPPQGVLHSTWQRPFFSTSQWVGTRTSPQDVCKWTGSMKMSWRRLDAFFRAM